MLRSNKLCLIFLLLSVVWACSDSNEVTVDNGQAFSTFSLPEQLHNVRALIDPELTLTINEVNIPVLLESDGQTWTAQTSVELNRQHHVEIMWTDQSVELVRAEEWFSTPTTAPFNITFDSSQFDSSRDEDGDGRPNLVELENDTDLNEPTDPPEALQRVTLAVNIPKPDELVQASFADNNLFVRATLNNGAFLVRAEDGINWIGQDDVGAEIPAFVTVEWCYRLSSGGLYRLLRYARAVGIGSEDRVLTSSDVIYRSDYDLDADGVSNIEEVVNGSAPDSSGDSAACQ